MLFFQGLFVLLTMINPIYETNVSFGTDIPEWTEAIDIGRDEDSPAQILTTVKPLLESMALDRA